jgi:hypothetical protein
MASTRQSRGLHNSQIVKNLFMLIKFYAYYHAYYIFMFIFAMKIRVSWDSPALWRVSMGMDPLMNIIYNWHRT